MGLLKTEYVFTGYRTSSEKDGDEVAIPIEENGVKYTKLLKERNLEVVIIEVEKDPLYCDKRPNELFNVSMVFVVGVVIKMVERDIKYVPTVVLSAPVVPAT